ncbi:hypothetical protein N7532_010161 [Penicillium argentinense]|uniref:Pre-mRNA-splicing factor SPF27 n=1 Tax=Penicillium argentinense TaxID=1131581 RepID=A0A9W9EPC1_9EURO|nr:uncharacterized protein N7532_010161 [Penicillium argentinense]KAJ5085390.1 hypothetical protein N7532_010161 [Penicillium argentinense]
MPLINVSHDSLPCKSSSIQHPPDKPLTQADVDPAPTDAARQNAQRLINAELAPDHISTLHPSIPAVPETKTSALLAQEIERKASGGIDLTRYEAPEAPTRVSDTDAPNLAEWKDTLRKAYISASHLSKRHENLTLLEEGGKNAWLIGNMQLEDILRGLEKELAETKAEAEEVNRQRKIAQESSSGELESLQQTWWRSVTAAMQVEGAADSIRKQILDFRRQAAQQQR